MVACLVRNTWIGGINGVRWIRGVVRMRCNRLIGLVRRVSDVRRVSRIVVRPGHPVVRGERISVIGRRRDILGITIGGRERRILVSGVVPARIRRRGQVRIPLGSTDPESGSASVGPSGCAWSDVWDRQGSCQRQYAKESFRHDRLPFRLAEKSATRRVGAVTVLHSPQNCCSMVLRRLTNGSIITISFPFAGTIVAQTC